nr:MAG TPA_asm: hypothetical protein [Caudoviricetes sp.]
MNSITFYMMQEGGRVVWWGKFSWCKKIGIAYFALAVWGCPVLPCYPVQMPV